MKGAPLGRADKRRIESLSAIKSPESVKSAGKKFS